MQSPMCNRFVTFIKKSILPFCITALMAVIFVVVYTPVFAINDDVMIESILSGAYYKVYPYTYYFSVPLGTILSIFYVVAPDVPWFGIFILIINSLSIFAIEYVAFNRTGKGLKKYLGIVFSLIFCVAFIFSGFVLPHYTVVAATLGAAGLVLFMSATSEKQFIAPIVFFVLSYLIRENVFFMMVPFVGIAFIYLLIVNKGCSIKGYFLHAFGFLAAVLIAIIFNRVFIISDEWKDYKRFNDIRTEVYDYTGIVDDDESFAYYESVGIDESEIDLIKSYNLMLGKASQIESELELIADYSNYRKNENGKTARLKEAFVAYKYRLFNEKSDAPYNYMVIGLYLMAIALILVYRQYFQMIPLVLTGIYRNAIWLYLFYKGRYPQRVTFSLFILEITILICIVIRLLITHKNSEDRKLLILRNIAIIGLIVAFIIGSVPVVQKLDIEHKKVCNTNYCDDVLYSYMYDHPLDFYYLDVYVTIARTKWLLECDGFSPQNYMLLGGWMLCQPLYYEKQAGTGYDSAINALKSSDNIHLVLKEGTGADINQFAMWVGSEPTLEETIEAGDNRFLVYSFCE